MASVLGAACSSLRTGDIDCPVWPYPDAVAEYRIARFMNDQWGTDPDPELGFEDYDPALHEWLDLLSRVQDKLEAGCR